MFKVKRTVKHRVDLARGRTVLREILLKLRGRGKERLKRAPGGLIPKNATKDLDRKGRCTEIANVGERKGRGSTGGGFFIIDHLGKKTTGTVLKAVKIQVKARMSWVHPAAGGEEPGEKGGPVKGLAILKTNWPWGGGGAQTFTHSDERKDGVGRETTKQGAQI